MVNISAKDLTLKIKWTLQSFIILIDFDMECLNINMISKPNKIKRTSNPKMGYANIDEPNESGSKKKGPYNDFYNRHELLLSLKIGLC